MRTLAVPTLEHQVVAQGSMQHDPRHQPALLSGSSDHPVVLQSNTNMVSKIRHRRFLHWDRSPLGPVAWSGKKAVEIDGLHFQVLGVFAGLFVRARGAATGPLPMRRRFHPVYAPATPAGYAPPLGCISLEVPLQRVRWRNRWVCSSRNTQLELERHPGPLTIGGRKAPT